MVELHLDQEAAHVGAKDGMDGVFFSRENLLYGAYLLAGNHVQVAVVDRRAGGDVVAVVVGNESEEDGVIAGGGEVIGRLLGSSEGLS